MGEPPAAGIRVRRAWAALLLLAVAVGCSSAGGSEPPAEVRVHVLGGERRAPSPVKGDLTLEGDEMRGIVILARDAIVRVRRQR